MRTLFFILFLMPSISLAHSDEPSDTKIRVLQEMHVGTTTIYLTAREDGHLLGRPFQTELRISCEDNEPLKKAIIQDSHSVCDLDPKSIITNNAETAIAVKIKEADIATYQKSIEDGSPLAKVPCAKKTKVLKFSLRDFCSKS